MRRFSARWKRSRRRSWVPRGDPIDGATLSKGDLFIHGVNDLPFAGSGTLRNGRGLASVPPFWGGTLKVYLALTAAPLGPAEGG